jgi:hypothetical protein
MWFAGEALAAGGPCAADVQKFCSSVTPGGGRVARCMKDHQNELSAVCRQKMAQAQQRFVGIQEACQDDVTNLCMGIRPSEGHILKCLKNHKNEISAECRSKLKWGLE